MSQTVAFVLPLPVALALAALLLLLLVLSVVALSLRKPVPVRIPARDEEDAAFRLGRLHIDGIAELSAPRRGLR